MSHQASLLCSDSRRDALIGMCGIALGALPHFSWSAPLAARELVVVGTRFESIYELRPGGEFSGMGVDLLHLFAQRYGYQLRFEIYPWRRAQELIHTGKADVLVGPYRSADRLRFMRFSAQGFFQDQVAFYVRANSMPVWEGDYSMLKGRRIATLNGWNYGPAFSKAAPQLNISVTNSVESGLRMLAVGRVEMFATNRRDTDPVLLGLKLENKLLALAPLIDVQDAFFAYPLTPRLQETPQQMDQMLAAMTASGELQKLARRYGVTLPQ